ncbi:MAG: TrkH family potassium uptake protein [Pseudomonadota bacterium]
MIVDLRPVAFVIGRLTALLGLTMLIPTLLDSWDGHGNAPGMWLASGLTWITGVSLAAATREGDRENRGLNRRQGFLMTTLVWAVLPAFGALPFFLAEPNATVTDAYFEAMSGLTTTGATVFSELDEAPRGMLLWRGMLQWFGGVGIVVFAIVFLPALQIGGMQFFRSESFDLSVDITLRAKEIAASLGWIYVGLTLACAAAYSATGIGSFDAIVHAMTTVATGGFGNYDGGFGVLPAGAQWVAILFMAASALPFLRLAAFLRGDHRAIWRDPQIRTFLTILSVSAGTIAAYLVWRDSYEPLEAIRQSFFNVTSVMTGTGYASAGYDTWGGLAVGILFILALIGGCTGSTSCSAKVFRYEILIAALALQIRRIHSPNTVYLLRYAGRTVEPEVISSIMGFFFVFFASLALWSVLLSLQGLDALTSVSAALATLTNLGPGFGPEIGPEGNFGGLPDTSKWLLSVGMLLGRLEFLSVLVILSPLFWRR